MPYTCWRPQQHPLTHLKHGRRASPQFRKLLQQPVPVFEEPSLVSAVETLPVPGRVPLQLLCEDGGAETAGSACCFDACAPGAVDGKQALSVQRFWPCTVKLVFVLTVLFLRLSTVPTLPRMQHNVFQALSIPILP